ncbi:hypothetical protein Ptr902_06627 [Pyrenophora tritici-repentis]|uniref:Uncharacterized protein n=1 Tax=Pyrenophora tritici-repentis TaxID=45151 RepID=A0A5M9LKY1_9PLEO|nr:hypothetical protein PtrV1_00262 [Pyrenophora tritici-repentis]KAF7452980.1 hypothetical protein A1F99_002380 [Pyrenophora tritici-repentis]KAF7576027.1 hypothetical protein PtrM4_002670 [Pyrenophora tritici-repentis]KAI0579824.1 hypothetical protein Alg215_05569 [Pyrenophora tritici-repentis]KAI0585193.1 hypothetical protein Alg130_04833 [Pyrenophora tritici-repentis]
MATNAPLSFAKGTDSATTRVEEEYRALASSGYNCANCGTECGLFYTDD